MQTRTTAFPRTWSQSTSPWIRTCQWTFLLQCHQPLCLLPLLPLLSWRPLVDLGGTIDYLLAMKISIPNLCCRLKKASHQRLYFLAYASSCATPSGNWEPKDKDLTCNIYHDNQSKVSNIYNSDLAMFNSIYREVKVGKLAMATWGASTVEQYQDDNVIVSIRFPMLSRSTLGKLLS